MGNQYLICDHLSAHLHIWDMGIQSTSINYPSTFNRILHLFINTASVHTVEYYRPCPKLSLRGNLQMVVYKSIQCEPGPCPGSTSVMQKNVHVLSVDVELFTWIYIIVSSLLFPNDRGCESVYTESKTIRSIGWAANKGQCLKKRLGMIGTVSNVWPWTVFISKGNKIDWKCCKVVFSGQCLCIASITQ